MVVPLCLPCKSGQTGKTSIPKSTIASLEAGKAYVNATGLDAGLAAWQQSIVDYGNQQGFTVSAG